MNKVAVKSKFILLHFTFIFIFRAVLWRRGNKVVLSTPVNARDDGTDKRAAFVFEFGAVRFAVII